MSAESRLAGLRRLLSHARARLGLDVGFSLWDGSSVPDGLSAAALSLHIADEGAVAALLRRPKLDTILNLWTAGRIDVRNGSLFDVFARRPTVRIKNFARSLDKRLALRVAAQFLLVPRGEPWPLELLRGKPGAGGGDAGRYNIQYHYDVSNAFYGTFLDAEMVYSCAYFEDWSDDLDAAQRNKLDMSCRKLRLRPGETLLDIGCGWGALLCHAARHYGVRAHGLTLSQNQFAYAREKVARLGLQDRVTVELGGYESHHGHYDKIASIGMFEHVGAERQRDYFRAVNRLLKPDGLYLHHAIVRPAKRDGTHSRRRSPEYAAIMRYVFPGAELARIGETAAALESFGFEIHDVEGWREHYARTCRLWHDRLFASRAAAEREAGAERTRLWLAYLAGCAIGFERGSIAIFQTLASKRRHGPSGLPPSRRDLYR